MQVINDPKVALDVEDRAILQRAIELLEEMNDEITDADNNDSIIDLGEECAEAVHMIRNIMSQVYGC